MTQVNQSNKRIAKNTTFLYVRMFFVLIISLYTSRLVLQLLGVVDYGVYNAVAGFVSMFNFLNATLSSSMQRFYNFEGARDNDGIKNVYSAGLIIHIILAAVLIILLETFGIWYLHNVMVIPPDRVFASEMVFHASVITLVSVLLQIPYCGAILSGEKMDYYAFVSIADIIIKLIAVICLPHLHPDKLILYALALTLISVFDFFAYFIYAKAKILRFRPTMTFGRDLFKSLITFSGWNLFGTFVFMLKGQGVNMVLNYFFGPVINAARGIANQVSSAVCGFSLNIMTAFQPQLVDSYSKEDYSRTRSLFSMESKIAYTLILFIIAPTICNIDFLLKLWLGDVVPEQSGLFASLVLIDVLVCTLNTPCTQVVSATGKLKYYQIGTSSVNILLIPICCLLLNFGYKPYSVFVATILISILNQCVSVYVVHRQFPITMSEYLKNIILPCLIATALVSLSQAVLYLIIDNPLGKLLASVLLDIIIAIPVVYFIILGASDREMVRNFLKTRLLCRKYL